MDTIADMLVKIKNASLREHETVSFPYSKLKHAILECLKKEGYVGRIEKKTLKGKDVIEVGLVYVEGGASRIHELSRISKPSKRVYMGVKDLKSVKNGRGIQVLSTPKGIMADKEARKELVGGEVILSIW
jgi:small subunit ribosomal protein S8